MIASFVIVDCLLDWRDCGLSYAHIIDGCCGLLRGFYVIADFVNVGCLLDWCDCRLSFGVSIICSWVKGGMSARARVGN